jgi:hypothetical protein
MRLLGADALVDVKVLGDCRAEKRIGRCLEAVSDPIEHLIPRVGVESRRWRD